MKRTDYNEAASIVREYRRNVVDELTREVLSIDVTDPVRRMGIEKIVQSYAQTLWHISSCLQELNGAGSACETKQKASVAEINCSRDSVAALLENWFKNNAGAAIVSVSVLDNVDDLTCIIVFYPT